MVKQKYSIIWRFFMQIRQFKLIAAALLGMMPCFVQAISILDISKSIKYNLASGYGLYGEGYKDNITPFIDESFNKGATDDIEAFKDLLKEHKANLLAQQKTCFSYKKLDLLRNAIDTIGAGSVIASGIASFASAINITAVTLVLWIDELDQLYPTSALGKYGASIREKMTPKDFIRVDNNRRQILAITGGALVLGALGLGIKVICDQMAQKLETIEDKRGYVRRTIECIDRLLEDITYKQGIAAGKFELAPA